MEVYQEPMAVEHAARWAMEKIAFWNDIWCGQEALKHVFPVLHSLSQGQEATVLWTGQGWNLFLRRGLNDWEMTTVSRFHDTMQMATN